MSVCLSIFLFVCPYLPQSHVEALRRFVTDQQPLVARNLVKYTKMKLRKGTALEPPPHAGSKEEDKEVSRDLSVRAIMILEIMIQNHDESNGGER